MSVTTRQGFLAATHDSVMQRGANVVFLAARRVAAAWDAAEERRIMAQMEPRLREDAGLERNDSRG